VKRGKPLQRRTPLRWRSKKRADRQAERDHVRFIVLRRDRFTCQAIGAPGRCDGPLDVHELIRRAQWADGIYDPDNCVTVCRQHHDWITTHPEEAHQLGLARWSWER